MQKIVLLSLLISVLSCQPEEYKPPIPNDNCPERSIWTPKPETTFDWDLDIITMNTVNNFTADIIDIDAFDNSKGIVDALHTKGKKVIAYMSVGTVEDWRPDAKDYPSEIVGVPYDEWEGEKWVDIRSEKLRPILLKRLDMIQAKGFDGFEPDNIDGFEYAPRNDDNKAGQLGFDQKITTDDAIQFCKWLSKEAHARNLSIGQKNAGDIVEGVKEIFDWALLEDAFVDSNDIPDEYVPYIENCKAVFATEYTDINHHFSKSCEQAKALKYTMILKKRDLTAWIDVCE